MELPDERLARSSFHHTDWENGPEMRERFLSWCVGFAVLLAVVGNAAFVLAADVGISQDATEFADTQIAEVDLSGVRACVDAAMTTGRILGVDLSPKCIGAGADVCRHSSYLQGIFTYFECLDLEAEKWQVLQDEYRTSILKILADDESLLGALSALNGAHQSWMASRFEDCKYVSSRWGAGTQSKIDEYLCVLETVGGRAIKYRRWLNDLEILRGE